MRFTTATIAAAASLLSVAHAHMIMHSPNPYGPSTINNSPLAADGSDFPCKLRTGVYDDPVAANDMTIGETNYLSFEGSVVHSGGSCQVSLTTDAQPDASSDWVVIHSIIGGCPSNHSGNFEDANANSLTDATVFSYSIPDSVDPGTYTLAWTWFNNEGNREMYMNCAPITVAAAKKRSTHARHLQVEEKVEQRDTDTSPNPAKRSLPTDLPKMFVANVGNGCSTADSTDLVFPDPGSSVAYAGKGTTQAAPVGSCDTSSSGSSGSASGSAVASSAAASTPAPSSAAGGGSPAVSATSAPAAAETTLVASTSTVAPAPAGTSAAASTSSGTASSGSQLTGACTDEGEFNCIDGTTYQQCASGTWSVVMSVAAGTECTAGLSSDLGIKFASDKMAKRHLNSRIMRSHSHARRGYVGYN